MNGPEAKMILSACQPSGRGASDSILAEALALVGADPQLQNWVAEERAFDLRVQAKLRDVISMPANLKTNLLNLRKTTPIAPGRHQPA